MYNMFEKLFNLYYNHIESEKTNEDIYTLFLENMDDKYLKNSTSARKVIDFMSVMTDDFFLRQYKKYFR